MSIRPEPVRITELRDESEELAMLQSGVRELRKQHGTAAQTEALAARLGPELASNVAAGTALFSNALLRFAFLGAGIIGLGMSAWWLSSRGDAERVRAPAPIAAQQETRLAEPVTEPPVLEATVVLPAPPVLEAAPSEPPAAMAAPARPIKSRGHADKAADKAKEPSADPEAELALLGRAQALLDRDPNGALDVLGQHARVYARGVFIEEREVLALEAESKLGHKALARARAERFIEKFPRSAHARRVRTLLEPRP